MKRILILFSLSLLAACGQDPFPRPRGYPRIDLPSHEYKSFKGAACNFTFDCPVYAKVLDDRNDSCLVNLYFPEFNYYWHFTYRRIAGSGKTRREHEEEYLKLVMKHTQKMEFLNDPRIEGPEGWGTLYELRGEVGAPAQMIFGDSLNLVMVSFYFQEAVNQDSLNPLIRYVKEDLLHMAGSLHWEN